MTYTLQLHDNRLNEGLLYYIVYLHIHIFILHIVDTKKTYWCHRDRQFSYIHLPL